MNLTDGKVERERINQLEIALRSVIKAWKSPGSMGTLNEMDRVISYANSVLNIPVAISPLNQQMQHDAKAPCEEYPDNGLTDPWQTSGPNG